MKTHSLSRREFVFSAATVSAAGYLKGAPTPLRTLSDKPAILGGTAVRSKPFPSWPMIEEIDEKNFLESLRRKDWCRLYGNTTTTFEKEWAGLLGAKYATGVVNGTNALYAGLTALDVGPGDEVLVPPYTFVASINAIIQQFALPVFTDTDVETFQLDPASLDSRVTENTRCIMTVHLGGGVADMDAVGKVASNRSIAVIEDACQAHFAEWRGKRVGSIGDIGCFSFQSSKILPCGEGGAIVTSREDLLDKFHAFQNNGRDRLTGTRNGYQHQGTNLRMTEFQAALLLAQLTRLEKQCARRETNANHLTALLKEVPGIEPAKMYEGCTRNTYYLFMVRYDSKAFSGLSKSGFLNAMEREGIPCYSGYGRLNEEPFLKKVLDSPAYKRIYSQKRLKRYWEENECPRNNQLCEEGVFIEQNCLMGSKKDAEDVVTAIRRIQKHASDIARS
jgi:dTDP-4-amino-4,6-dideoxygalactose transaminase